MSYNLVYTRRAEKDLRKLDTAIKRLIGKSIIKLQDNPLEHSEKLTDPKAGTYRFRTGDYRIIFDIEGKDVVILRVGHRKEIYKRL
ncbi:MAG: type II toxin-antitoxin system RelE/ParE family toxin [Nitrospirae bacterium]|jgi:mRNA interferase RelE/StbE|nr:type II toxin-antitoxin system RelE/ParE family toxin [Nitrospirota bacterium]